MGVEKGGPLRIRGLIADMNGLRHGYGASAAQANHESANKRMADYRIDGIENRECAKKTSGVKFIPTEVKIAKEDKQGDDVGLDNFPGSVRVRN